MNIPPPEASLSGVPPDRYLQWPLLVTLGGPALLVVLRASPIAPNFLYVVIGIPALLGIWCLLAIGAAITAAIAVGKRHWRRAISAALLPAVVACASLSPLEFIRLNNFAGDVVHYLLMRPYYLAEIAALPTTDGPRLAVFNWGGMIWASSGLVYDESGEIGLPPERQSAAWKAKADKTELSCGYTHRSLGAHFYLADFSC